MPGVSNDMSSSLTRTCSHSNDNPAMSPSSAPSTHKAFSFIHSSPFSFSRARTFPEPAPIPESDKEPIFDEIRDCDEAPYPLPPQTRKMSAPGPGDIVKPKAEYKNLNGATPPIPVTGRHHLRAVSATLPSSMPSSLSRPQCSGSTVVIPVPPHKHKWLNKLDPRFNAKLMEEQRKTIERQQRERQKKREDEELLGDLLQHWVK